MTQPDTSPVPIPVRVMLTMPSSNDEPHSVLLEPAPFNNIYTLLESTKSIDDNYVMQFLIFQRMRSILCFMSIFLHLQLFQVHSCINNCKFSNSWLEKYPWLLYSPKLNAVFCGPFLLLLPSSQQKRQRFAC